jgi:branched-chain amino acid transport system substrate-binding protein
MKNLAILILISFSSLSHAQDIVGVGVPLSGDGAWLGESVLNGVKLYLKEHNIDINKTIKVEDVSLTQSMTSSSILGVRKLIDSDKAKALILCVSPVVNAVAPYIDKKEVPAVAIVGAETALNRKYQVRLWPSVSEETRVLTDHLKGKKVAVLYTEQDAMLARKTGLENALGKDSNIVFSSSSDNESLNTVILKLLKTKPDAVALYFMPGLNGLAAKKLRQFNFKGEFVGSIAINAENEIKLSEGTLKGALYPDSDFSSEFKENYKTEYGVSPSMGSAPGYDAAKMIFEAMKEAGGNNAKLNELLHNDNFTGSMGTYGLLKDNSNSFKVPVVLRAVGEE